MMQINSTRNKSVLRNATLALIAFSFFQPSVGGQSSGQTNETIVVGKSILIGLARGDMLRFTAFNPLETESGRRNQPISVRFTLFLPDGTPIAESPQIEIPPGEFRSIDFKRDELPIAGEPHTARQQFRTTALWGLRARGRFPVTTSLEIVDSSTGQTREMVDHGDVVIVKLVDA
jgi:hypothetical protein